MVCLEFFPLRIDILQDCFHVHHLTFFVTSHRPTRPQYQICNLWHHVLSVPIAQISSYINIDKNIATRVSQTFGFKNYLVQSRLCLYIPIMATYVKCCGGTRYPFQKLTFQNFFLRVIAKIFLICLDYRHFDVITSYVSINEFNREVILVCTDHV